MSDIALNQIFIAHPVEFAAKSLEHFSKQQGVEAYILGNLDDFAYLLADFKPQALVIHEDLLKEHKEGFERETKDYDQNSIIVIVRSIKNDFLLEYPRQIIEPFEPHDFTQIIKHSLESHNKTH